MLQTSGSASVLEEIERENLFVVPLDMSRRWYRYHQLFGELLRAELQRSEPDLVAGLHRRAAAWFEAEGLVDEAVRHLVAAGDIARSVDLIAADWVNEFNGGGLSTVSGWLDLLPDESVRQDPRLSAARAWIALNVGQFDDAHVWIEAVEAGASADTVDHGSLGAQLVALRAVHAFKTGDVAAALEAARRAITLDFDDALQARSAACCIYGCRAVLLGQHRRGPSHLPAGRAVGREDRRSAPPYLCAGLSRFDRGRIWSARRCRAPDSPGNGRRYRLGCRRALR